MWNNHRDMEYRKGDINVYGNTIHTITPTNTIIQILIMKYRYLLCRINLGGREKPIL